MSNSVLNPGTQYTIKANTIYDDAGATINLGIIYKKMLAVLMSKKIGLINATVANRDMLGTAGVGKYFVGRRNNSRDYTAGTSAPNEVGTRPVNVPLDYRKEISIGWETLDLMQMGVPMADGSVTLEGALIQNWLDGKAKSLEAYLYGKLLQLAVNTGKTAPNTVTTITIAATQTNDDYRKIWKELTKSIYALENLINAEIIGSNHDDGTLWVDPEILSDLILAMNVVGSDKSATMLELGMNSFVQIGGIKVISAPFLGKTIAAGAEGLDQDEAFDFTGMNAIWVHREALAFPMSMGQSNVFVLPSNGNIHNFHKFMVNKDGGVALRPKLVKAFNIVQGT